MSLPAPVRVAVVDIAHPLDDLDCERASPPPYTGAWILVCHAGRPAGIIQLPLDGTLIGAAQLEHEVRRQLGAVRPRTSRDDAPPLPRASVVVPSNVARPAELRRCVARLADLDYPDYEVIVVDNRHGDPPPIDLPGARVVREPRPGISAARNRGASAATGEIIAFTDDDDEVDRGWLRALGERFAREPDVAAVSGLMVPRELQTPAQVLFERSGRSSDRCFVPLTFERCGRFRIMRRVPGDGDGQVRSLYETGEFGSGANMAFRAEVFRKARFDEALGVGTPACAGEDLAFMIELLMAGYRIAFEPTAILYHSNRATLAELERHLHGYGIGFTAMLVAIALRDPRHVIGLASVLPAWLRSRRDHSPARRAHREQGYPRSLARAEWRGMLAGPFAYLRSRRAQRRWA
jgi:GT2 family glycosyltransferase